MFNNIKSGDIIEFKNTSNIWFVVNRETILCLTGLYEMVAGRTYFSNAIQDSFIYKKEVPTEWLDIINKYKEKAI